MQFVHEDDVVEAFVRLLDGRHAGAYNLAGEGTMMLRECAERIGLKRRRVPQALYWRLASALWWLRLSETPPGNLHFALHPWVVATDRLKSALDWKPRHTTRETFDSTMRAHGLLDGE